MPIPARESDALDRIAVAVATPPIPLELSPAPPLLDGWTEAAPGYLLSTIVVHGCSLHLQAIEVDADGRAVEDSFGDTLEELYRMEEPNAPFTTAEIAGKTYVVWAAPYAD